MLTKEDLQQIREAVREEVIAEAEPLKAGLRSLDKKLDQAQKDISTILTEVITHHEALTKRVRRIEEHLGLTHQH